MHHILSKRIEMPWLTLVAYCFGVLVIIGGMVGMGTDIELATSSPVSVATYCFSVMCVIWGVLICVATRLRYRGGLWFFGGAFLVGGALVGTVSILETQLRGWHYSSPVAFYIRIASCLIVGCILLFIGQRRHRRMSRDETPVA